MQSAPPTRLPSPPGSSASDSVDIPLPTEDDLDAAFVRSADHHHCNALILIRLKQEELQLLDDTSLDSGARSRDHELRTAPIFTRDAYNEAGFKNTSTQYGVLGKVLQT